MGDPTITYFAAEPTERVGEATMKRVQMYYASNRVAQILRKQQVAAAYYYDLGTGWLGWGSPGPTNMMARGGAQGEQALIRINHARSLVNTQIAMVSNAKYDRRPRAASDDYDAMAATEKCRYVLDHYQQLWLESRRVERIRSASTLGEGYTHYWWNPDAGAVIARPPGQPEVRTGDVECTNILPWNVIRHSFLEPNDSKWAVIRFPNVNKWDLARRFPDHADEIVRSTSRNIVPFFASVMSSDDGSWLDDTEVFRLYHKPTPILPLGRDVIMLSSGLVLSDTALLLGEIPLVRVAEAPVYGSPFGYPSYWEYLGVQELSDFLQSVVASNQSTFGMQNIAVKRGVDPRPVQMAGGLNVFETDDPAHDVVPLQLTKSPAEIFGHMKDLRHSMELLSGMTSIDRGEAQGDRQSGAMGALLSAQSIRNAAPYQTSDVEALRFESKLILRMLRAHATRPIQIGVSERNSTPYTLAITNHDLGKVDDVDIELENPLLQTSEGRIAALQTMAQLKIPLKPEQAFEVMVYGRLGPVTDGPTKEGMRIRLENKMISDKKLPHAMLSDDHVRHCVDHKQTMSGQGRDDLGVVETYEAHTMEHYALFYGTDPNVDKAQFPDIYRANMMVLFGNMPPPPRDLPLPGAAGATPPPAGGEQSATPPPAPGEGPSLAGSDLPKPPVNPSTGHRWTPKAGGGTPKPSVPTA